MIPGDGIGPEISQAVKEIFASAGVSANYPVIIRYSIVFNMTSLLGMCIF